MKQKRYWLRGGIFGLMLVILALVFPPIFCPDFYKIGPSYPTDQPICYSLIVGLDNARQIEIRILIIALGVLAGWFYGKIKNKKASA